MEIILGFITLLSLSLLGIVSFFCFRLIKKILYINENIDLLLESIEGFNGHLNEFNSLESYSNEPVVLNLVSHSKDIISDIEYFLSETDLTPYEKTQDK